MLNAPENTDTSEIALPAAEEEAQAISPQRRRALGTALSRTRRQIDRASAGAAGVRQTLRQIRQAVDPREVAGGYVGLTAGEAIGGAVGGAAGAVVAGPPGALVGAEVGAFTVGMVGLKLGMEAVEDAVEAGSHAREAKQQGASAARSVLHAGTTIGRKVKGRTPEIAGLTSGAVVGLVVAGPVGGLVGAVLGETVGERASAALKKDAAADPPEPETTSQSLSRFGKTTAGEATTILVAGSVGALFGPSGLKVGERLGRVVSKRVEWDKLGSTAPADVPALPGEDDELIAAPAAEQIEPAGQQRNGQHEDRL